VSHGVNDFGLGCAAFFQACNRMRVKHDLHGRRIPG
jgi:hypothetical protein